MGLIISQPKRVESQVEARAGKMRAVFERSKDHDAAERDRQRQDGENASRDNDRHCGQPRQRQPHAGQAPRGAPQGHRHTTREERDTERQGQPVRQVERLNWMKDDLLDCYGHAN